MNQNTAEDRDYFAAMEAATADEAEAVRGGRHTNAQILRTLGHALESHRFLAFEISTDGDLYIVKGSVPPPQPIKPSLLRSLQNLFNNSGAPARSSTQEIELRYSLTEILSLDARVRGQRSPTSEMADPHSLSQLLRGIGSYLDRRSSDRLVSVALKERWVVIVHRNRDGKLVKTRQDIEYFYNFWIKMYLQRSGRPAEPPPNEPTVCVAR